jgi:hypothetical protein
LPKAKRARLHANFAGWLERFGGGRDEHAPLLAHHYAEAVRPADADLAWLDAEGELERLRGVAITWLRRAADLAIGRYDIDEALELLHRAVDLAPAEMQADLWREIGKSNALKYDGEAFWQAVQKAISMSSDRRERAELYGLLASETTVRLGMWRKRPDRRMVKQWVDEALELTEDGTPARVQALVALAAWDSATGIEPARQAVALAGRLGSTELLVAARTQLLEAELGSGRTEQALIESQSLLELLGETHNPDDREGIFWGTVLANLACGRIESAREYARLLAETARALTPHHRVHGVGMGLMVEELAGCWDRVLAATAGAEKAVAVNLATPCTMNARSLLVCALAAVHAGDQEEAQRLERLADGLEMEGYGLTIDSLRLRLALVRGDLEAVERLVESDEALYFGELAARASRLDALVALGRRDGVEEEAMPLLRPNTYLEPFALRALGLARDDRDLMARALGRFEALGLDWHAAETRALL